MRLITLVENNKLEKDIKAAHGLSFYLETEEHKILFDVGPDKTFIKNAEKLNVNLTEVDIVVISHGHVDHGGGLKYFLEINKKAKIYVRKNAFEYHYTKVLGFHINIGLDEKIINDRFVFTNAEFTLDNNIQLFSYPNSRKFWPSGNLSLFSNDGLDYFSHEQSMLIHEKGVDILFCGCAHTGIYNILTRAERILGKHIEYVIGGFHLAKVVFKKGDSSDTICALATELAKKPTKYYTCHCTGLKPYHLMKMIINENLEYLYCGGKLELPLNLRCDL